MIPTFQLFLIYIPHLSSDIPSFNVALFKLDNYLTCNNEPNIDILISFRMAERIINDEDNKSDIQVRIPRVLLVMLAITLILHIIWLAWLACVAIVPIFIQALHIC